MTGCSAACDATVVPCTVLVGGRHLCVLDGDHGNNHTCVCGVGWTTAPRRMAPWRR